MPKLYHTKYSGAKVLEPKAAAAAAVKWRAVAAVKWISTFFYLTPRRRGRPRWRAKRTLESPESEPAHQQRGSGKRKSKGAKGGRCREPSIPLPKLLGLPPPPPPSTMEKPAACGAGCVFSYDPGRG